MLRTEFPSLGLKPNGTHDSQGRCPWLYYFAPKGRKKPSTEGAYY